MDPLSIITIIIIIILCLSCMIMVMYSSIKNSVNINFMLRDYMFWLGLSSSMIVIFVVIIYLLVNTNLIAVK